MDQFYRVCCGRMVFLLPLKGDVVSCAEGLAFTVALSSGSETELKVEWFAWQRGGFKVMGLAKGFARVNSSGIVAKF